MSAIKKFFQKKKADAKFKLAGPGHRLNEETVRKIQPSSSHVPAARVPPSAEAQQAAAAALARMEQKNTQSAAFNTSLNAIRAQVRRELEAEKQDASKGTSSPAKKDTKSNSPLTVQGVYFKCPLVGPEILSKEKWNERISEFLYEQLEIGSEDEMGLTAALIIHSCNRTLGREKVSTCVDTICKYLENIVAHPDEEKYRKIRCSNRVYRDRVAPVQGSDILLRAAGFQVCKMLAENQGNAEGGEAMEDFLMFDKYSKEEMDKLTMLVDALRTAESIQLELDRNTQVLLPSQAAAPLNLPPDFFTLSPEELKREMELRAAAVEQSSMLRTKAMREREELRERKLYRYSLIRIRFPDGVLLQGTFSVYERFSTVVEFVQENLLVENKTFVLILPSGDRISSVIHPFESKSAADKDNDSGEGKPVEDDKTLMDLHLVPNAVLHFSWEKGTKDEREEYLKPDVMILLKPV
ncbi:UBX domain-containing protein 6 [Ischnura elegans]|uniref:UBX domain-containing protein 6 n=1 Tax=Ischnura elegans TaxID=197161 RepID=UPI001ED8BD69|nr:UBX domain-containing protein 6 [Ischnura elegans]